VIAITIDNPPIADSPIFNLQSAVTND
jgi:hypothetical protein